ncbi:unnamed protein product [Rotaria magnacalcarata]|uniref:Uncharacterized protein n=2 Tax=Rotaria magnacalcarata TaxID=392030 RepID=A0A8S2TL09_9BILA|nr:unnamed protein product [Rotaria magnacalcarata]
MKLIIQHIYYQRYKDRHENVDHIRKNWIASNGLELEQNCLGVAYPIYVEPSSDMRVEKLVGNILDSVNVPTPVAQAFHFFKGAADR